MHETVDLGNGGCRQHGPTQTDNDSNRWQGYCVTQQSKMTIGKRIRREALGEAMGLLDRPVASGSASMNEGCGYKGV